jgi:hypothetical protein
MYRKCAFAREDVMNQYFDGGDQGHGTAADNAWQEANNCGEYIKLLKPKP